MILAFLFQFSIIMIKTFFHHPISIHDKLSEHIYYSNKSFFLYFKCDSVMIAQSLLSDNIYQFPYDTHDSIVSIYYGNKNIIDQFVFKNEQLCWQDPISLSLPYFIRDKRKRTNLIKLSNSDKMRFLDRLKLAKEIKSIIRRYLKF